jgi:hypothetical protein
VWIHVNRGRQTLDAELGVVHKFDYVIAIGQHVHICGEKEKQVRL